MTSVWMTVFLPFAIPLALGHPSLYLRPEKPRPWYKWYGFLTEQEFNAFWATYGNKIKLLWPKVSPAQFSSYEEYTQKAPLASVKTALSINYSYLGSFGQTPKFFGKVVKITTSDGRIWEFDLNKYVRSPGGGFSHGYEMWIPTYKALWDIFRIATSPLVVSIEASTAESKNALGPGEFELFVYWIMQNRLPIALAPIPNIAAEEQPPAMPPPYVVTAGGTTTGGTTTGGTTSSGATTGGTTTGGTTIGGTTTGGTTTTGGATTTAVVKSALPYVAIGAGVLLLLWAMKK
jgi:hypothetical protein